MTDKRGHRPVLLDSITKLEQCKNCKELRKRGEKWATKCLYPKGGG